MNEEKHTQERVRSDNDELRRRRIGLERASHFLDNQPSLDSFRHVHAFPVEEPLRDGLMETSYVPDVAASYDRRNTFDAVRLSTLR